MFLSFNFKLKTLVILLNSNICQPSKAEKAVWTDGGAFARHQRHQERCKGPQTILCLGEKKVATGAAL